MHRAHIFQMWRNGIKRRRENGDVTTAAMMLGLTSRPLKWEEVLRRRRFPLRENLEPWRMEYYRGEVSTPVFGNRQSRHELKRAF